MVIRWTFMTAKSNKLVCLSRVLSIIWTHGVAFGVMKSIIILDTYINKCAWLLRFCMFRNMSDLSMAQFARYLDTNQANTTCPRGT